MTSTNKRDGGEVPCVECGMPCRLGEYHPYTACLMFKSCRNSKTVRENLAYVLEHGAERALAESRAECERLRSERDFARRQLFDAEERLAPKADRAERLAGALREWWLSKRPASWNEASHRANHRVNCTTKAEETLADAALEQEP